MIVSQELKIKPHDHVWCLHRKHIRTGVVSDCVVHFDAKGGSFTEYRVLVRGEGSKRYRAVFHGEAFISLRESDIQACYYDMLISDVESLLTELKDKRAVWKSSDSSYPQQGSKECKAAFARLVKQSRVPLINALRAKRRVERVDKEKWKDRCKRIKL